MVDQGKVGLIRKQCAGLIGQKIIRFQTAESLSLEDLWFEDSGFLLRIFTSSSAMVVMWSKFDDLWLASDLTLPTSTDVSRIRWVDNALPWMAPCLGRTIDRVLLGKGQMSIEGQEIEIWTRLAFDLGDRFLEVCNGLDQNSYEMHSVLDEDFVDCLN